MNQRTKNKVIFVIMLLIAAGIYIWYYPLDRGELSVSAGHNDYRLVVGEQNFPCPQDPCVISLKTGGYQLKIEKGGYFTQTLNFYVKRGKGNEVAVELKKIPTLTVSPIVPRSKKDVEIKKPPKELQNVPMSAFTWDPSGSRFAFVDQDDSKLKIWSDGSSKIITTLKNIGEGFDLYWSPNQKYLLGNEVAEIYFINIDDASRKKKIFNFNPQNITWSLGSNTILVNNENNQLHKITFSDESIEHLGITLNLKQAIWANEETLIFFTYNEEENKTIIESYNPVEQGKKEIMTKFNFPITNIGMDANKTIYFYNSADETWYKLDY